MDIIQYKGYDIQAAPWEFADGGKWKINIDIIRHHKNETKTRNFYAADTYDTRGEAVSHCFQFGRQIIDGQSPPFTVADL